MEIIGLIAEYNPFHNGHLYQINKIKELYPDSIIILVLNGYFLERGLVSLETKEEKAKLALEYGVDLVVELPFIFGSNSADIFAEASLKILNSLHINRLIFGSESNNIEMLYKAAREQFEPSFNKRVKDFLKDGLNYPTSLNKAGGTNICEPNDLLGVSYIKAIIKNDYNIEVSTIKRTNDYHDTNDDKEIVSAENIRSKLSKNEDIKKYIPAGEIQTINYDLLYTLLKYKVSTDNNLSTYLTVDEGIENKLIKEINNCNTIDELVKKTKTKRYTYNKIMRMFIHILISLTKDDKSKINNIEYIKILGFNRKGRSYLNSIKSDITFFNKSAINTLTYQYEIKASKLYDLLTNCNTIEFEKNNKPIKKD